MYRSSTLFGNEISYQVRHEYLTLLSHGINSEQIEQLLINYYSDILDCGHLDETLFWTALAYCQWRKGLLSNYVKDKTLKVIDGGKDLEFWKSCGTKSEYNQREKVLKNLKNMLLSDMPVKKKTTIKKDHRSPWPVGTLLAYHIISDKESETHPLFGKYALLRVVENSKIIKSKIFPDDIYDESTFVGLYGWVGDKIPDPSIVEKLQYIPIMDTTLPPMKKKVDYSLLDTLSEDEQIKIKGLMANLTKREIAASISLSYGSDREWKSKITVLDCDKGYQKELPQFFTKCAMPYVIVGYETLDKELMKRLISYYEAI